MINKEILLTGFHQFSLHLWQLSFLFMKMKMKNNRIVNYMIIRCLFTTNSGCMHILTNSTTGSTTKLTPPLKSKKQWPMDIADSYQKSVKNPKRVI